MFAAVREDIKPAETHLHTSTYSRESLPNKAITEAKQRTKSIPITVLLLNTFRIDTGAASIG